MDELAEHFDRMRSDVEPRVKQPPFAAIRARHRRRVRNQRIAAGTATLVVVVAGYGVVTRAAERREEPINATLASEGYVPPPTGQFGSRDVAFVDATTGWALGSRCGTDPAGVEQCHMGISRTTDAGDTWTSPAPIGPVVPKQVLATSVEPSSAAARSIRFVNQRTGYVFNPALYVSVDGGRSWTPRPTRGQVVGVGVSSLGALVTTRECPRDERDGCRVVVLRDRTVDGHLEPLPVQPPAVGGNTLLRLADDDIWVLSYGPGEQRLVQSSDVGRSWEPRRTPCAEYDHQHFSAQPGALWVVCSVVDRDDDRRSEKAVYVSPDDGRSWELRGSPSARGVTNDIKAAGPDTAFLSSSHGDLLRTTDGGRTWRSVARDGGYINLEFPGDTWGWFFGPKGALHRYRDGEVTRLDGPA